MLNYYYRPRKRQKDYDRVIGHYAVCPCSFLVDRGEAVEFRSTQDEISFSPMKGAWLFAGHQADRPW